MIWSPHNKFTRRVDGITMLGLFRSRKQVPVTVGSRYRNGDSPLIIWEVASTFDGIDGTPYAQIVNVNDLSRRKTVAQSALEAGIQYKRLAP